MTRSIKRLYDKMDSVGSSKCDGMPKAHNPLVAENRILNRIEATDILKERYRHAVEYMDLFKLAWEQLSDDHYVFETFYSYGSAAYYIAEYMHIKQPIIYKRKNRALDRLTVLLFDKS